MRNYCCYIRVGILNSLEYRVNFFIELLNSFFPIIVQFFVWSAVYGSTTEQVINGFTFQELILYIIVASLVSKVLAPGIEDEISNDIRNGGLNTYLVRPVSYFKSKIFTALGTKAIHILICMPVMLIIYIGLSLLWQMPISISQILLFFVSISLALVLNCCLFFCLSLIAFWTTQTWGIMIAFRIVINILSGGVLPLSMLGNFIDAISVFLPFRYILGFSIDILQGNCSSIEILYGFIIQFISIALILLITNWVWQKGQKKYMAVGG